MALLLLLVVNLFISTCYKLLLLAAAIDFSINHLSFLLFKCLITVFGERISFPVHYVYSISHWYGPAVFCSVKPFRVLLRSLLNLSLPVGSFGSTLKSRVYSSEKKCAAICCSKWSYAVTQMFQTEMRWCMVTAVQASRGGVMVSGPFNWYTVGPLMAIERCLNARAYLNNSSQVQPFIVIIYPQGDDMYFEQDNILCHGDRIVQECTVQDTFRWNNANDLDTSIPWYHSHWDSLKCGVCRKEQRHISLWQLCEALMSVWFALTSELDRSFAESLLRHVWAVIRAEGGPVRTGVSIFQVNACVC